MLKEKVNSIRNALVKVEKGNSKKSIENLIMIAIVLVITLIAVNYVLKDDKKNNTQNNSNTLDNNIEHVEYSSNTDFHLHPFRSGRQNLRPSG